MRHAILAFALVMLLADWASGQIISYAAPLPVVAGGTGSTIGGLVAGSAATIGFASTAAGGGTCDTCLTRDAANTLALGSGGLFRVYNSSDSYLQLGVVAGYHRLITAGTTPLSMIVGPGGTDTELLLQSAGAGRWQIGAAPGHLFPGTDNTRDLGTTSLRARSGYFGTSVIIGSAPASALTGAMFFTGVAFASLGTPTDGHVVYCTTCDPPTLLDQTCTSAGAATGALAHRRNGVWKCL